MQGTPPSPVWYCKGCNLPHTRFPLNPGASAQCGRCGTHLFVTARTGPNVGLAWACCALICFSSSLWLPFLEVTRFNDTRGIGVSGILHGLSRSGMQPVGLLSLFLIYWLPLLTSAALIVLNLHVLNHLKLPGAKLLLRLLVWAKSWAMPEVYLLSVTVAYIKIRDLVEIRVESGLWLFTAATLALLAALQRVERDDLPNRVQCPHPELRARSNRSCLALLIAAALLLVPANALPMLEMRLPGQHQSQTLIGGVLTLFDHGMFGIALVVFIASLVVPFAKIVGLLWLLRAAQQGRGTRSNMQLHRILAFIGRWSMLDVFLVALLGALIQFGSIATLLPGAATPAFATAVILTAIAVDHFDTRNLWTGSAP